MADAPLYSLRGVRKSFQGRVVLDLPELDISGDGITVIKGPNGAGKSVLINILGMLGEAEQGLVLFRGREIDPADAAGLRGRVTLVAQDPYMFNGTVERNVALGLTWRGVDRAGRKKRAREALDMVGLVDAAGQRAQRLSGGERQRAALARALVLEPEVLLLDEPFAALDEAGAELCQGLVAELARRGTSIVMVLHSADQTARLAGAVINMARGRIAR